MRLLLCSFLLLAAAPAADRLAVTVEDGTSVTKTYANSLELELVGVTIEFDGEEIEVPEDRRAEVTITDREEIVFVDEYESVEDGRPTEVVRTFETLADSSEQVISPPDLEEISEETIGESDLEGRAVKIEWDADGEEYTFSFDDDGDEDDELLADLHADADFRFLLPEDGFADDVEVGDSWDVEAQAFDWITSPSGDLKIDSDEEDETDDDEDFSEQFRDNLGGALEAKYASLEDDVATIEIEGEVSTEVVTEVDADEQVITQTYAFVFDGEGTLLWDVDRGVCLSFAFSGDVEMTITMENDGEPSFTQVQVFEGTFEHTAEFE